MKSYFEAAFFVANRQRLRTLFSGTAPIVLTANSLLQRNGDTTYPFRQDSSFWYFTGCNDPDVILVLDKDREYFIVPHIEETRSVFDGTINTKALREKSGIHEILDQKEGWRRLETRLKKVKHVATISAPPDYAEAHGMFTNPARSRLIAKLKTHNENLELLDLRQQIILMRMIKQPQELEAIRQAIFISQKAFKKANNFLQKHPSCYEYELQAIFDHVYRSHNANHAYQPIVAAGVQACTLHYVDNDRQIQKNELVLIDSGAEVEGYSADITRVLTATTPTKRQQQIIDTVKEVQAFGLSQLKVGVLIKEYEKQVSQFMGEKLRELGLIKSIEEAQVRQFYPHATSHFLGLDVHDVADYQKPLEAGMVLTVEPGIYIKDEKLGVRIEDDVLITKNGVEVISNLEG